MKVFYKRATLTVDGGSNGILTIASTSAFAKGAAVFLKATDLPTIELVVAEVLSDTTLAVKLKSSPSARYNCTGYTVALAAFVVQPEQEIFVDPPVRVSSSDVETLKQRVAVLEALVSAIGVAKEAHIPPTPDTIVLRNGLGDIEAERGDFSSLYVNNVEVVTNTPTFQASIAPKARVMTLGMEDWRAGASSPTHDTYGADPRKSGWRYTPAGAGNQEMEMFLDVPDDIDVNFPCYIEISVLIPSNEVAGNTCEFQIEYVSASSPGSLAGASTIAARGMVIDPAATTAGSMYSIAIELDPLNATNPLNTPDCHVAFGLKRSLAGTIGNVVVLGTCFKYTSKI